MSVIPSISPARRRSITPYVLVWVLIGAFATVYLTLLGLRPEFFAGSGNGGKGLEQQFTEARRDMTRAFADLDPLRRTVGEMKLDVANLKIVAKETRARDQDFAARMDALENPSGKRAEVARIGEATTDSATAPQAAPPPAPRRDPRRGGVVAPLTKGSPQKDAPQKDAKVINGAKQSAARPIETGSIARKAKAAAPKPAAVGLLLATGPSIDSLRLNWSILNDRHADAVKSLAPRYVVSGKASRRIYSLVAGPVSSRQQAKRLCQAMAQKGLACEVATYRGNAL